MKGWLILLWIGALLFAACGSETVEDVSSEVPDVRQIDPLASPLERELGFSSEPAQRRVDLVEMQAQADVAMVECMQAAGFFYAVDGDRSNVQSGAVVGDGSRLWVEANGLGITRSFMNALLRDDAANVDAANVDAANADAANVDAANADLANLDYVQSLTPEQAAAYDVALVGDAAPDPSAEFDAAGCWGASYGRIVRVLAVVDEFNEELMTLNARFVSDPRFQTFQQEWSVCMDAAGFRYDTEQALADDVFARLLDIELVEAEGTTQAASEPALASLLEFELAVAGASFDCRTGFSGEAQRLRADYEQEFLDDNRFRIAELVEAT